jgi:hypothetical protein
MPSPAPPPLSDRGSSSFTVPVSPRPRTISTHARALLGRRPTAHAVAPPRGDSGLGGAAPPEETAVSHTDAHAPFRVRVARREVAVRAVHRCAGRDCDLPDLDPGWADARSSCRWEFVYTGTNVCSCWMCHWRHRSEERRAAVRARLRAVAREWNTEAEARAVAADQAQFRQADAPATLVAGQDPSALGRPFSEHRLPRAL